VFLIPVVSYLLLCLVVAIWAHRTAVGSVGIFVLSVFVTPFIAFIGLFLWRSSRAAGGVLSERW
jgi:hypothetical protein